jgi:hypothetical protein
VRICELGCVAFALWTLCAHAVVAVGGTLRPLALLFVVAAIALSFAVRGIQRRGALLASAELEAPTRGASREPAWKTRAALGVGSALALLVAWQLSLTSVWLVWCLGLAAASVFFVIREAPCTEAAARGRGLELALWATAGLCALYALVAHRADADDAFYVNLAVAAIDRPDLPLLAVDTLHGREDLPIHFPIYRLHSLELAYAAIAWLCGLPAIVVMHLAGAAVAAAALPLAHAVLLRQLLPRNWLAATLALVFVLGIVGEPHRWYGNFAFVRIWQGKSILLFVLLPLVSAFAIRFALRPTGRHWALLAAAQIAGLGCSANASWLAPLAAGSALLCAVPPGREGFRRSFLAALASAYVLGAGLAQRGAMVAAAPTLKRVYQDGEQLADALNRTVGDGALAWLCVVAIGSGWALCSRGLARRYAIVAPLVAATLLLSPFTDAWVRANLTGPSYWRAMWAVPIPLLLALALVAPLQMVDPARRHGTVAACCALALGFGLFVPRSWGWSEANEVVLGWPGPKRPAIVARWSALVNERAPGRRVLAPSAVSDWIPTWHDHAYPLLVRDYLLPSRARVGQMAYRDRHVMTRYVSGRQTGEQTPAIFARGLDLYAVDLVCLRVSDHISAQRSILEQGGFTRSITGLHYEIWERRADDLPNTRPQPAGIESP